MKTSQILISFLILFSFISFPGMAAKKESKTEAAASFSIKGLIQDQQTREKLAGVSIQIGSSQETYYSDPDGSFILPALDPNDDSITITINSISYKEKVVTLDAKSLKKKKVNVLLEPVLP